MVGDDVVQFPCDRGRPEFTDTEVVGAAIGGFSSTHSPGVLSRAVRAVREAVSATSRTLATGQGLRSVTPLPLGMSSGTEAWSCVISQLPSILRKQKVTRTHM